jgi:hypothetical protein
MDVELLKLTDQIFTAGAKAMIAEAMKYPLDGRFRCPVTGRRWAMTDADKAEQILCKAKVAQLSWTFTSPDWAPSTLPVHENEIFEIEQQGDDELFQDKLVAQFARSLAHSDYDFIGHPGIEDWAAISCGSSLPCVRDCAIWNSRRNHLKGSTGGPTCGSRPFRPA